MEFLSVGGEVGGGRDVGEPGSHTVQELTVYDFKMMYKTIHIICHYIKIFLMYICDTNV